MTEPKYIAGMIAKRNKDGIFYASCYGLMYLVKPCRVRCGLRPFCIGKSRINKLREIT